MGSVHDEPTRTGFLEGLIDLGTEIWQCDTQMVCVWQAEGGAGRVELRAWVSGLRCSAGTWSTVWKLNSFSPQEVSEANRKPGKARS